MTLRHYINRWLYRKEFQGYKDYWRGARFDSNTLVYYLNKFGEL